MFDVKYFLFSPHEISMLIIIFGVVTIGKKGLYFISLLYIVIHIVIKKIHLVYLPL